MNENSVTDVLAFLEGKDKEVAYDFLLKPFGCSHKDVASVSTQENYGATIPDLVISLNNGASIRVEVKINNTAVITPSEKSPYTRDLFITPADYPYATPVSVKKTTWTEFFRYCDRRHCEMQGLNALRFALGL
jgi:hypothetical protein